MAQNSVDKCNTVEYIVFMSNTKLISLRVREESLIEAQKLADLEKRSRSYILSRWIDEKALGYSLIIYDSPEVPAQMFNHLENLMEQESALLGVDDLARLQKDRSKGTAAGETHDKLVDKMAIRGEVQKVVERIAKRGSAGVDLKKSVAPPIFLGGGGVLDAAAEEEANGGRAASGRSPGLAVGALGEGISAGEGTEGATGAAAGTGSDAWDAAKEIKLCAACESGLSQVKDKWVCGQRSCGLYGLAQKGKR